jgi:hypothetical protein
MNGVKRSWIVGAVFIGSGLAACGGGNDGGPGPNSGGGPPPEPVPIRRLTNAEYLASAADLFPGFPLPELSFVPDTRVLGFLNVSSSQTGSLVRMEQYEAAALKIAAAVTSDPSALTGCDAASAGEAGCTQPYLYDLAKRAYRRPLIDEEKDALWSLFLNPDNGDYPSRLAMAIAGVLLSPNFSFRPELGDSKRQRPDGILPLTPWEVATRLSYFINGSAPDAELTAAADGGRLVTVSDMSAQARRLLALPRSQANLVQMHEMWLRVDSVSSLARDAAKYPALTPGLPLDMAQETRLFLQNVMFGQEGTFSELLLAPYTFGNAAIAALYGAPAPATDWDRIDLDPAKRSGLLTQASLLANLAKDVSDDGGTPIGTSVHRGKFVLEQLLCRTMSPPSAEIQAMFPRQDFSKTAREASTEHRVSAVCAGCHDSLDPLGLPFEHYDALGQWRDTDRGTPIDTTGSITTDGADGNPKTVSFDGVPELSRIVAELPEARACYLSQWFRFSTGKLNADTDKAYIDWLTTRFAPDKKLVDLMVDLVTSDSFRQLRLESGQ